MMLPNRIVVWEYHNLPLLWVMEETPDGEFIEHLYYVVYPTPDNPPGEHYGPYSAMFSEPTMFRGRGSEFFNSYVVYPSPSPTP
jgi:hypothetical protein